MRCVIDLPSGWINPTSLESAIRRSGQPHGNCVFEVEFRFPVGSKLMIDAAIRVLSLANQLALTSRRVRFSFDEGEAGTMGYLNRAGFFDHLAGPVDVTGGSTGIGLGTAKALARAGARVAIAIRKADENAVREIEAEGGSAMQALADVSAEADVERMIGEVVDRWGRLDALVNNAGIEGEHGKLGDTAPQTLEKVLQVNVLGVFLCMHAAIRRFLEQKTGGAIVNIASGFSFVGYPESSPYAASKGAVMALTRSAALEYARQNIRINAVCPMDIDTPMVAKSLEALPGGRKGYEQSRVTGRLGRPEEVGEAVVFLCSERSSFVIGSALMVDGGYTAQ